MPHTQTLEEAERKAHDQDEGDRGKLRHEVEVKEGKRLSLKR